MKGVNCCVSYLKNVLILLITLHYSLYQTIPGTPSASLSLIVKGENVKLLLVLYLFLFNGARHVNGLISEANFCLL